jgi:hypothetical protein
MSTINEGSWDTTGTFSVEFYMREGQVFDAATDKGNDTIQKLAHIITKLPEQWVELIIEFRSQGYYEPASMHGGRDHLGWPEEGDDERTLIRAYLLPLQTHGQPNREIRIRPSLADELFQQYIDKIQETEIDTGPDYPDEDRYDENVQKLADTITEDPDIFA